ncbi:REP element-mobilizing transposase RayT [Sporobacter termitidis DSM 10068]|uniref:REP element-mobilizing transposase RayT n=1 Tax=Sporobacter termitidis DSM 10068 TaxID=1123282 RepID=A0A1M5ZB52_9FIRM|nr:transposase [Sporobacter termitidis]SHI21429.1 REP element-mobilizing transposase RayT [Sporobacter termitidis DSM 10068]
MDNGKIEAPFRKQLRLKGYNYSQAGYYFVTICTLHRREILGHAVGGDAHIAPSVLLSEIGAITEKYIKNIDSKYENVYVDKYAIMPNHIHMIIELKDGAMWASPPTNTIIPKIIRTLKTLVTKEAGTSIFQKSYYDHIIRDEADYFTKWNYIDTNPAKWADDEYCEAVPHPMK